MLEAIGNALRIPELRRKILFTLGLFLVFRIFAHIAVPGADKAALDKLFNSNAFLGLLDLFSGGGLSTFSIIAMGVNPYINASIIMQLMTVVSTRIKELSKEGEYGRRKITRWTRWLTVALGLLQAWGLTLVFSRQGVLTNLDWFGIVGIMVTLTAGTVMLMWFGELITEYGIGNGFSLVIFAWIVGRIPNTIFILIFGFTYFYTAVTFDPVDTADYLKKHAAFIPGIRPGVATAQYLDRTMTRITFAGALFLGGVTVLIPLLATALTRIPTQNMYLGGTAILIVVGVALDTMKQIETQLIMRQYKGFIK